MERLVDRNVDGDVEELGETADGLAQYAVVQARDGVGHVVYPATPHPPRDRRLDEDRDHEDRNREHKYFHEAPPLSPHGGVIGGSRGRVWWTGGFRQSLAHRSLERLSLKLSCLTSGVQSSTVTVIQAA